MLLAIPRTDHPDLIVGVQTSDDAGVFRLRDDLAIVNTVDFFTPIVDDPYTYGQISAANSLSDVYAMGGVPKTAMNIVCFPQTGIDMEVLKEILRGGADKAQEVGVVVVGGHSVADEEIKYGMAVTGVIDPSRVVRNVGARPGDALVLTKALGTGILATALKHERLGDEEYDAMVRSMTTLNAAAARAMLRCDAHACTDVTGYGLLGHGYGMAVGSGVTLRFEAGALPVLPGALAHARAGSLTGGSKRNRAYLEDKARVHPGVSAEVAEVAFDPQTSGGLLVAVAQDRVEDLLAALRGEGVEVAVVVGRAEPRAQYSVELA